MAYKAKYFVEKIQVYKIRSVCIWGKDSMTKKTDEGICKLKYRLLASESSPNLLLIPPQVALVGRKDGGFQEGIMG